MAFTRKILSDEKYIDRACEVEKRAMNKGPYLRNAWNYYKNGDGALVGIFDGELLVGIGRLSVMPDKIGWLECLRVHPDYQRKGCGKLIYEKWLEVAKEYDCRGLAMFTSTDNRTSSGLRERYGLFTTSENIVYRTKDFKAGYRGSFRQVNWERAVELIVPKFDEYGGYMTTNRTFYRINAENAKYFADMGFVFEDEANGDFAVLGSRFRHSSGLNILMMGGNTDNCIRFCKSMAGLTGVSDLTCTVTAENKRLKNILLENGFSVSSPVFITKERIF